MNLFSDSLRLPLQISTVRFLGVTWLAVYALQNAALANCRYGWQPFGSTHNLRLRYS
jgi:hypothetical protein